LEAVPRQLREAALAEKRRFFPRIEGKSRIFSFTLLSLAFMLGIVIGSLYSLFAISPDLFTATGKLLSDESFRSALSRTLKISLIVAAVSTILSYPTAIYINSIRSSKVRRVALSLVWLPVMVNPIVRAYGWMIILGRYGIINSILSALRLGTAKILYTDTAIVFGLVELFTPFLISSIYSSLSSLNEELLLAARTLGAGAFRTFLDVVIPLTSKGYLFGLTVIIAGCFTAYTTPVLLGGAMNATLSMLLYEYVSIFLDWRMAVALSLVMLAIVISIMIVARIAVRGRK
jgi:putative spermidine/putrescine transport system permease protein